MDTLLLSRIQFGANISFHILFPTITIALGWVLLFFKLRFNATRDPKWMEAYGFWVKVFALTFALGVVSGITMSFQFGTNWPGFMETVGNVAGPLLAYEVLTAFFLEAGFLGVMLFGRERVGEKLHVFATGMVALGTFASGFWILAVNSWMQTPDGHVLNAVGQFVPDDWFKVIFNPSFPYRLVHMMLAAYLTTAFVVAGLAAYHLLKVKAGKETPGFSIDAIKKMFSMAMWMAAIVVPMQIYAGDAHGLNTLQHQPLKIAAMEGHFKNQKPAGLVVFGIPNQEKAIMEYKIEIPVLGSVILHHNTTEGLLGYESFPRAEWPPMAPPFYAFRVMVGIGMLMLLMAMWSLWLRYKKRLYDTPLFLKALLIMGPSGFVAVISGWIVTEVGRQPYTVYGLLRTADSMSPIDAPAVAISLIAFIVIYFTLFGAGFHYIFRQMKKPPMISEAVLSSQLPTRAAGFVHPELTKTSPAGAKS